VLRVQLEETQKEKRRQFERAPYGLCVCTADGVIAHANHTLVQLLGYRRADDLRRIDFAATVFEDAGELRWLLERSASTGRSESIETTWKTKDRRRLAVRLQALATANASVEIVVEDITHARALEQRLRQAHRMEAVGRLAAEVAVTCDRLLRDAARAGEQLFAIAGSDSSLRHQGEMLLGDVTRAASLLRQLAVYGKQQTSALEPVNVHRLLRDLEPVLKRVAGDEIDLVLPRSSSPADVDVDGERVERILVNVASYARGRMPYGGQVRVGIATTVVGRKFIARYPNVRPGPHVVVTVTELRRTAQPDGMMDDRDEAGGSTPRAASGNPGVDLGVLLELVGTCGGHLWMEAEPAGNMTLRIHLPKRPAEDLADPAAVARGERGLQLSRWFRSSSPAATAGT
jgi:PAS domain S-box-containing protein